MGSGMGAYGGAVRPVESAAGETMLLWGLGQPTAHRNNALVRQAAHSFELDACGRRLSLLQSPSSMATPGVTGAVVWDSGVVLAKFLEHAVDSQQLLLRDARASGRPRIRMRPGGVRRRAAGSPCGPHRPPRPPQAAQEERQPQRRRPPRPGLRSGHGACMGR